MPLLNQRPAGLCNTLKVIMLSRLSLLCTLASVDEDPSGILLSSRTTGKTCLQLEDTTTPSEMATTVSSGTCLISGCCSST